MVTNFLFNWATDEKRVMYEKQFLNDVATQNYTKYNINVAAINSESSKMKLNKRPACAGRQKVASEQINWFDRLTASSEKGKMFTINKRFSKEIIQSATAAISGIWCHNPNIDKLLRIHLPWYDPLIKGNAMSRRIAQSQFIF